MRMLIGGVFEIVGDVGIMVRQRLSEEHIKQNPEKSIGLWTKNSILGEGFFLERNFRNFDSECTLVGSGCSGSRKQYSTYAEGH